MLVRSPSLGRVRGVRHAFSTREGGVSRGPFASLDLAFTVGDDPDAVTENRRRFTAEAGFEGPESLAEVSQVHGDRAVHATREAHDGGALARTEADALVTETRGLAVAVRTADCAPVLIAALDASGRAEAVAALHAGWRGAVGGVVKTTVSLLVERGARPERMIAAIGPAIGPDAFEVGEEVVEAARESLGGGAPRTKLGPRGRPLFDLPDLVRRQLVEAGLPPPAIDELGLCTHGDPRRFFSHRRDRGQTGRHLSAVSLEP